MTEDEKLACIEWSEDNAWNEWPDKVRMYLVLYHKWRRAVVLMRGIDKA